jgi:outer membrane protein
VQAVLDTLKEETGMNVVVRRLGIGLVLICIAGARPASAQQPQTPASVTPPGARIAFVNARAILQAMPGYAKAESLWTKEFQTAQGEGQKLQVTLDSAVANYRQAQAMLSPSQRSTREKSLAAQEDSLQAKLQGLQERVQGRQQELIAPMQQRLTAVIEGIRAEGNYWVILDYTGQGSGIISYDKSLDISDRVARRLQQSN